MSIAAHRAKRLAKAARDWLVCGVRGGLDNFSDVMRHGGALDAARRLFPKAPEPWLDLSTGINPVPYPIGRIGMEAWTRLPDAAALADLERLAGVRYAAPAHAVTIAAPGTQAIIQRLPAICGGRDVRILGPTYGEYESLFRAADAKVQIVPTASALAGADVAIVVNPNNPDGRVVPPDDLVVLAQRTGRLVIDEAFVDILPQAISVVPRLPADRMIVLRSFGKTYGLAGLRLGFAIAPPAIAAAVRRQFGAWPVAGPAIQIGRAALPDELWLAETRARLRSDGARLRFLMGHVGASPVGATPLFQLVSHPAAPKLFDVLARQGILTRPFAHEPRWLRVGLPASEGDWERLGNALQAFR